MTTRQHCSEETTNEAGGRRNKMKKVKERGKMK
jgi:hypothetical protein